MTVYDKWGFDEDGYNREGYNKMGFDREGYNKQGFNIHGFNRQGLNQRTLRDSDGYDADGYDIDGFNRDGFDMDGYDKKGFNKSGYNRAGFDKDGYTTEGFNREGFDRDGFDHFGYDKDGFDRNGLDKEGYYRSGYNVQGFDREGYDSDGYNKDGFDRDGYDIEGFNSQGIDKTGFNREGYDIEGYNRAGFNKEGFDRDGYDREGFNAEGFDKEGYDRSGYNKEGFNRKGFDREGYDVEGYNIKGFDRKGFDKKGYDKDGYNKYGIDAAGFDRDGYDRWGFNKAGIDRQGFDIHGYDVDGFNILGYDAYGFDREGIHRDGFAKSDFDEYGYHIFTGFNLQGYDKEGYNINGFNADGYDRDGFNIDGYDAEGFNRNGFNKNGYDHKGFNINGFNAAGYDKEGYDIDGFDKNGVDRKGYDREGYDQEGFDRYGYDHNGQQKKYSLNDLKPGMTVYHKTYGAGVIKRFEKEGKSEYIVLSYPLSKEEYTYSFPGGFTGSGYPEVYLTIEKPEKLKQKEDSYSESEDQKEKKWYSDLVRYLRGTYQKKEMRQAEANFKPSVFSYFDKSGFLTTKEVGPGIESVQNGVKLGVEKLVDNPYFAHIDYAKESELYIGKKEIPGYVTDWADKKASLYYQYQMYIGNATTGLKLVREIDFGSKRYLGYRDLYNALTGNKASASKYADERLSKIIASNQADKKIHDIIETIQQNQYEIITQDKDHNILVLGCAGSGKTMILMHRIRFMKYNDPGFDMKKIMVISPTDILGKESQELSRILDIGAIQQMTMTAFYRLVADDLLKGYYEEPNLLEKAHVVFHTGNTALYDEHVLNGLLQKISGILSLLTEASKDYIGKQTKRLEESRKYLHEKYGSYREFQHLQSLYRRAKEELEKYGEDDLYKVIYRYESTEDEIERLSGELRLAELVYAKAGLEVSEEDKKGTEDYVGFLSYTKQLSSFIDMDELYLYLKKHDVECESESKFIQLLCAFKSISNDQEIAGNLLQRVRSELAGYTDRQVFGYISRLRKRKHALEEMPKKARIIRYLMANGMTKKRGNMSSRLSDQQMLSVGNDIISFFDEMHWQKGMENPFTDFDDYEELQAKTRRLKEFEQGKSKWRYLQDIILDEILVKEVGGEYYVDAAQAFAICYFLTKLSGICNEDKHYFYIDEFQDFSNSELKFLMEFMPNSVFNFFGDYQQCINPKGIASEAEFGFERVFEKKYQVNENYRNARNITEYVNKRFGMSMLGIGLAGIVEECEDVKGMPLEKGDRGAVVVADGFDGTVDIPGCEVHYYDQENVFYRDAYNIIPVSQAKGLEFEKVIVLTEGMTENQKYVACTRAIKALQVV